MKGIALSLVLGFAAVCSVTAQAPAFPASAQVVRRLYADFACEAVIDDPGCDSKHQLLDQPQEVLQRYFDAPLTRLWLADRKCEARTHGICNIDFLPIWSSQDPSGTFIRILPTSDSARVDVELRHPFYTEPRVLQYALVRTVAGWRIHDIARPGEWSLVALLSAKR